MKTVETEVGMILAGTISAITQRSIFNRLGGLAARPITQLTPQDRLAIMAELENSVRLFARRNSAELIASCAQALGTAGESGGTVRSAAAEAAANAPKRMPIDQEKDIATARLEAWSEAVRIGLSKFTSVKVATAVSELARNIVFYAGKGTVELRSLRDDRGPSLQIIASDKGPGIEPRKLDEIWSGTYKSQRGMGKGLVAVKKLVDDFHLDTGPGRGTTVTCLFRGER
jgi:serine/threonine-protein kinase RsbT